MITITQWKELVIEFVMKLINFLNTGLTVVKQISAIEVQESASWIVPCVLLFVLF